MVDSPTPVGSHLSQPIGGSVVMMNVLAVTTFKGSVMPRYSLESIILIVLLLWLLGAFVYPVGGGLIHLLLVVVLVVVVIRLLQGRTAL